MNFKKLLATIGFLIISAPSVLTVPWSKSQVRDNRILLKNFFKDFKFKDNKGVQDFLDSFDFNNITKQISDYIIDKSKTQNLDDFEFILEDLKSNSIIVKAKDNSKQYVGEVKLKWNLKLFEICGVKVKSAKPKSNSELKGYLYLDKDFSKIKFYDAFNYFNPELSSQLHPYFSQGYHSFDFIYNKNKDSFTFIGTDWINDLSSKFDEKNFSLDMDINVTSPELNRISIFDEEKGWIKLGESKNSEVIHTKFDSKNGVIKIY